MSVELEPSELGFKRPFTHEVSQTLRLHNTSSDAVAFKVKTTAPKQYCVRPNSGRIEPSSSVEVQVLLQAMKEDPPPDARCRDKFLVQSVAIPPGSDGMNVTQVWHAVEQTAKGSVSEKKIRVTFLPADGSAGISHGEDINGSQSNEQLPPYSSPSPASLAAVTPQKNSTGAGIGGTPASAYQASDARSMDSVQTHHTSAEQQQQQPQSSLGSAAAAVSSAIPTSRDDLQRQLDAANAQIKNLQQSAAEGLRQRRVVGDEKSAGGSSTTHMMGGLQNGPAPGGVPVQIVAALCLVAFLIAYLLF